MSETNLISDLLNELSPAEQELLSGGQLGLNYSGFNNMYGTLGTGFGNSLSTTVGIGSGTLFSNAFGSGVSRGFSTRTTTSFNNLFGTGFGMMGF